MKVSRLSFLVLLSGLALASEGRADMHEGGEGMHEGGHEMHEGGEGMHEGVEGQDVVKEVVHGDAVVSGELAHRYPEGEFPPVGDIPMMGAPGVAGEGMSE